MSINPITRINPPSTVDHPASHPLLPILDKLGKQYCFNCVVEEHQTRAYNLAVHMLGDWSQAEDATQEAFISAYRSFNNYRGVNLAAWLMRIVANYCRDMLRIRKSRPSQPLDVQINNPVDRDATETSSPENLALRSELRQAINKGLNTIHVDQRLALILVDIEGFSYDAAAEALDCNIGTIKSRLSRGRAALRNYLLNQGELLPHSLRQYK
ncbi:MAG: sigma-70 family RNA polymerase sigma factor [SAR202 cluster bacterium]|nr:sigma-70 family RNA polymerase sigma factor [SAR202 cluster bacterium]